MECHKVREKARRAGYQERKAVYIEERGGCCEICGVIYPPSLYEFHHLDPSKKEFEISYHKWVYVDKARKEANKCSILCPTCHSLEHTFNFEGITLIPRKVWEERNELEKFSEYTVATATVYDSVWSVRTDVSFLTGSIKS